MILKICVILLSILVALIPVNSSYAEPAPFDPVVHAEYEAKLAQRDSLSAKEQLELGIHLSDITCSNGKTPMLKLSENTVTCVYNNSVDTLQNRDWGVSHKETDQGARNWECIHAYQLISANDKPSKSELIKKFRITIMEFSKEEVYWKPIEIRYDKDPMELRTNGKFTDEQSEIIASELSKVDKVRSVETRGVACY